MTSARLVKPYSVWVEFSDGLKGEVDLENELEGEVFRPLRDRSFFAQLRFDTELRTVVWPNGADFSPEFLRSRLLERQTA